MYTCGSRSILLHVQCVYVVLECDIQYTFMHILHGFEAPLLNQFCIDPCSPILEIFVTDILYRRCMIVQRQA